MTRLMYDSIYANNLPDGGQLYAGYVDGEWPDFNNVAALFPNAVHVPIATNPNTKSGAVGDGPPDNGTWPEWVQWVKDRRAAGEDPTLNTDASMWPDGQAAFEAAGVVQPHWWIADYDNDPTIPAGAVAKQYASGARFDTSSVVDYWPGVDKPPQAPPPPTPVPTPVPVSQEDDMRLIQSPAGIWLLSGSLYIHIDQSSVVESFQKGEVVTVAVDATTHAALVAASTTPSAA